MSESFAASSPVEPQPGAPVPSEVGLARAIVRRCHGRTLVIGEPPAAVCARLAGEGIDAERGSADALSQPLPERSFDTVLVVGALERLEPDRALPSLQRAYAAVGARGQLLVCVPHSGAGGLRPGRSYGRAELKQLLEHIDQPKVHTDQPFAWLLMAVAREPALEHAVAERCRVIAELCRGRVLELGCGPGHLSAEIARRGHAVVGVDLSARKIARARARHPDVEFRCANILDVPLTDTHDTVILAEVLEHVPADVGRRMLEHSWALVAPGGQLVVSVPNEDCVPHRNHLREFTVASLGEELAVFGPPRVETAQPFKWLLMRVERPPDGVT